MIAGIELGLIYAVMALGVYLTFRVLDFPDLTVDQSFTTGAATSAMVILNGGSPWIATVVGFVAGGLAGLITAGAPEISDMHARSLRDGLRSVQLSFREASVIPDPIGKGPGEKWTGPVT